MPKINIHLDKKTQEYLNELSKKIDVAAEDTIKFGIKFLYGIMISGGREKEYLARSIKGRYNLLDNIMLTGFAFYTEHIKEIFENLSISEDGVRIQDISTEDRCFSALAFDSTDIKYGSINFFNHEETQLVQLNYYIDKEKGEDWVNKLKEKRESIIDKLYEKFGPEDINISIEDMEDSYNILIDLYIDTINIKEVEKYLIKKLGRIPT